MALVASAGCRSSASDPTFDTEVRAVNDWASPPGASISKSGEDAQHGMTISKTWELSVPLEWPAYQDRLRGATWSGYHERERTGTRQAFSRVAGGDMFILSIDLLSAGPPLRVRVTLTAMPD